QVQADERGVRLAQVDDVLHVVHVGGRGRGRTGGVERGQAEQAQSHQDGEREGRLHASASLMGLAILSAMRMGRPTLELFCFSGSMPRARQTVARKSGTATGRFATSM